MNKPRLRAVRRQHGMTLIMALIMLVVLTLLALTSFNLGKSNLQIVSNMQSRNESVAAAHEVIEQAISNTNFFEQPEAVLSKTCGEANSACVDTNGDGTDDVKVVLSPPPTCVKVAPIKGDKLDLNTEDGRNCSLGETQNSGVEGSNTGNSACADSTWEITAVATDLQNQSTAQVVQGVAVRVPSDDTTTSCPTVSSSSTH
jgi:Tfp pilus assembly protein PilX